MNGKTYAYLDLAALPAVGDVLLDPAPAWVFRSDGAAMLWANAAGARFFGTRTMGALLERRIGGSNPLVKQLARLARTLPTAAPRLEILRLTSGVSLTPVTAACRRINLSDGQSAVLAVAASPGPQESIVSRAETLADCIAGQDCLVAVIGADGRIVGASGGFQSLSPASATIDELVESVEAGPERLVKRPLRIGGRTRAAGAARFEIGGEIFALLIVGPEENDAPTIADVSTKTGPTERPAGTAVRFLWQMDRGQNLTFVSDELGRVVGADTADIVGKSWRAVADSLGLDPDGRMQAALDGGRQWSGITLTWPTGGDDLGIAAEMSGFPITERGVFSGHRGFGILHPDDRRPMPSRPDRAAADEPAETVLPPETGDTVETIEDIDAAARKSIEQGLRIVAGNDAPEVPEADAPHDIEAEADAPEPDKTEPPPAAPVAPSNVVRLPGTGQTRPLTPDRLSGSERDAFRRIAETLGAHRTNGQDSETAEPPAKTPTKKPPAAGDASPPTKTTDDTAAGTAAKAPTPPRATDTSILDRLPIGIVVFREAATLFVNRMLLELLGYDDLDDFVAAGGSEALFPDRDAEWVKSEAGATPSDLLARRKDGDRLAVEARLQSVTWAGAPALMLSIRAPAPMPAPLPEPAGPPVKLLEEIASAEARLSELEVILDTATDGVVVIDGDGRIGNLNRSAEALFGIEAGDVLGLAFTDLLAEESRKPALDYLDGLASNGVASVLNDGREVIGKVPQGGLIPLFMTMGRLGRTGKFCAVLRDITHWKTVEDELIAARRAAEAANTQKSDFLAKISHEIRTPLNAIIGFSEVMMEERFGPIGNARYRDYLRDIHVSGAHLLSLINDLLDLSKIEAGKLELAFEAVAVNGTIQECVALMQPQANRERIIIRTSLAAGVPNVVADPRSLRQILLNLLSNAIKFTKAGGQVIVSTAIEDNGEVAIRVRDTGIGMNEKDIETALKPFRQLATSGRERGEGTGLGLPLTKALVEANRASFSIDSAVNQGTLVKITFPTTRVLAG